MCVQLRLLPTSRNLSTLGYEVKSWVHEVVCVWKEELHLATRDSGRRSMYARMRKFDKIARCLCRFCNSFHPIPMLSQVPSVHLHRGAIDLSSVFTKQT